MDNEDRSTASANTVTADNLRLKPPFAAAVSTVFVGLGQAINGQPLKGLIIMCIAATVAYFCNPATIAVYWIASGFDAYQCAKTLEEGGTLGRLQFILVYKKNGRNV